MKRRLASGWVIALVIVAACGQPRSEKLGVAPGRSAGAPTTASAPGPSTPVLAGSWERVAQGPLTPRAWVSWAWDGTDALVWGGLENGGGLGGVYDSVGRAIVPADDAASYGIATGQWHSVAALPSSVDIAGDSAQFTWTGHEVLAMIWNNVWSYDPQSDQWHARAKSPFDPTRPDPVGPRIWNGRELFVWLDGFSSDGQGGPGAAYDPTTDRWRTLAPLPFPDGRYDAFVWTGDRVLAWGGVSHPVGSSAGTAQGTGASYDPVADRWTDLPSAPIGPRFGTASAWTGSELVIWGGANQYPTVGALRGLSDGAAYDPIAGTWRRLPSAPTARAGAVAAWVDGLMLIWGGRDENGEYPAGGLAYDVHADRWLSIPDAPFHGRVQGLIVGVDHGLLVWGGNGPGDATTGAVFKIAT